MLFPDFFIRMFSPRFYGWCLQRFLACAIPRLQLGFLYLHHPGICELDTSLGC